MDNRNRDLYYHTIRSPHIRKCFARLRLDRGNNYNAETEKKCDECDVPHSSTHLLSHECTESVSERRKFVDKMKVLFLIFIHMTIMNQCKVILNLDHRNGKVMNDICGFVKIIF